LHDQELRLDIGALLAAHRLRKQWRYLAPDLAPDLRRRPPQRPWVLAANDGFVGIIVEIDQLLAPADPDRLLRGQHDADRGLQVGRPMLGRADRCAGPIAAVHDRGKLAAPHDEWLPL